MKQFRLLFAVILLWAGVASSYASYSYSDHGTRDINGVTYHLYYYYSNYYGQTSRGIAYVEGFDSSYSGSEITILESITDDGESYKVEWLRYNPAISRRTNTLSSSTVQTIHFQSCPALNPDESSPTFDCPNLKTIYFEGASPSFGASYESYFKSPGKNNITVWVSDKTPEEIDTLRTNSAVWCDFAAVNLIPNANVKRNVFLTISNARMYVDQGSTSVPYIADKELQVDLYSNLSFRIDKTYGSGNPYEVMSVKLNGQEFLGEMHDSGTYYWYDLRNITNDVFISVASENTKYEASVICNDGGTCYSSDAVIYGGVIQPGDRQTIRWDKSNADGSNLQIRPKEGYTLDHLYYNSYDNTNRVTRNSDGTYSYNLTGNAEISVVFKSVAENILFADPNVKAICIQNWDTNHDGELSKAEAAAVTTLGTVFKNKADITSFDEFQYFTGLTAVEADAFYNASLTSIVLPNTITEIKLRAFSRTRLTSIQFPEGLTTIGERAFDNAESLEYVKFPQSLEKIDYYAFQATAIRHIFIPQNVTYIGDETANPFSGCKKLVSIVVDERNEVYDSRDNCNAIIHGWGTSKTANVIVGCQSTILPKNAQTETINLGMTSFNGLGLKKFVIPEHFGSFYQFALAENDLDSLIIKKKEAFSYSPYYFSFSSQSAPNMLNTVVVVPYGMKAAYVAKGWVGEGDDGTQVVKQVVEAEPEGEEYVGEEFTLPVCTSRGGFTYVYYTQSNGDERSISINTSDGTVYDEVTPLEDGRYRFVLRADQIKPGKTMPVFIYQKIGEDVNYDLNGDGTVNVTDLTLLVNYILHH